MAKNNGKDGSERERGRPFNHVPLKRRRRRRRRWYALGTLFPILFKGCVRFALSGASLSPTKYKRTKILIFFFYILLRFLCFFQRFSFGDSEDISHIFPCLLGFGGWWEIPLLGYVPHYVTPFFFFFNYLIAIIKFRREKFSSKKKEKFLK